MCVNRKPLLRAANRGSSTGLEVRISRAAERYVAGAMTKSLLTPPGSRVLSGAALAGELRHLRPPLVPGDTPLVHFPLFLK